MNLRTGRALPVCSARRARPNRTSPGRQHQAGHVRWRLREPPVQITRCGGDWVSKPLPRAERRPVSVRRPGPSGATRTPARQRLDDRRPDGTPVIVPNPRTEARRVRAVTGRGPLGCIPRSMRCSSAATPPARAARPTQKTASRRRTEIVFGAIIVRFPSAVRSMPVMCAAGCRELVRVGRTRTLGYMRSPESPRLREG